jgi:hypothetical protein
MHLLKSILISLLLLLLLLPIFLELIPFNFFLLSWDSLLLPFKSVQGRFAGDLLGPVVIGFKEGSGYISTILLSVTTLSISSSICLASIKPFIPKSTKGWNFERSKGSKRSMGIVITIVYQVYNRLYLFGIS